MTQEGVNAIQDPRAMLLGCLVNPQTTFAMTILRDLTNKM